jgi:hypothetical protein
MAARNIVNHMYFDESIHQRGGFILGAYIFGPSAESRVSEALDKCDLRPNVDEYKSSMRMADHAEQLALRSELRLVLTDYKVGVLVMPSDTRRYLGEESLRGLDQFARMNSLTTDKFTAFFDEGVFSSANQAAQLSAELNLYQYCDVKTQQNSRIVKGIQLADLVAHSCATMLLETMGLITKRVKAGPRSGYDAEMEIELGFELWASLRYQFFLGDPVRDQDEIYGGALMSIGRHGLYISQSCSEDLRKAAVQRFGQCYMGCIH